MKQIGQVNRRNPKFWHTTGKTIGTGENTLIEIQTRSCRGSGRRGYIKQADLNSDRYISEIPLYSAASAEEEYT